MNPSPFRAFIFIVILTAAAICVWIGDKRATRDIDARLRSAYERGWVDGQRSLGATHGFLPKGKYEESSYQTRNFTELVPRRSAEFPRRPFRK